MSIRARLGAIAAVLLLGLMGLLAVSGRPPSRATSDHGPEGTAALAGVFERLGYEVRSLRLGLHVLGRAPAGLLVLPAPPGLVAWPPLTDGDASRVLAWAQDGGTVLALTDRQDALVDALGVTLDPTALRRTASAESPSLAQPTRPALWTQGGPLSLNGRSGLVDGVTEPLYVVDNTVVVSLHRIGEGTVILVSDPSVVSNASLSRAGNLALLVEVARHAVPDGGTILFDDLHAGGGDGHGVVAYARSAGAGGTVVFALLALVLLLWRLAGRDAALVAPEQAVEAGGTSVYVRGLAGLYDRAELGKHALAVTSRQFRAAVEQRCGIAWERSALEQWLSEELGAEAAVEFHAVRQAFAVLFVDPEPSVDAVLGAAQLAARFEHQWLRRPGTRSRTTR